MYEIKNEIRVTLKGKRLIETFGPPPVWEYVGLDDVSAKSWEVYAWTVNPHKCLFLESYRCKRTALKMAANLKRRFRVVA